MEKFLYRCERVLTYIAVLSIFIMMCLTTADAIGRYFFGRPITGAYELTEKYFMLVTIFLGIAYAYRGGAFIRVGILMDRMPRKVKVPINYFGQIFSIALWGGSCLCLDPATVPHPSPRHNPGLPAGNASVAGAHRDPDRIDPYVPVDAERSSSCERREICPLSG